ncbi:MAG: ABC transporter ATP-binding protein [Clostridia bacterium]|nr:ABC transporter ATP-binding protein [Clostridia bacterium]
MIALENVTKKYGRTVALNQVSFEATEGRITGLLGRNGAGKTTALNLLTGYFPPDEGRVLVAGMDMMEEPRECKRHIGYLPEQPPLYDEMTVTDYLKFVCDLREVLPRSREKHVGEILDICALREVRGRVIGHLSKGYRQRMGIAQALCGNPEILILDEPTVGLDPKQVVEIRELIRSLGEEHTILFSSHILSEVQQLCDRAIILHEGRVIRALDLKEGAQDGGIRLRISALGKEKELTPALRSIGCVQKIEVLPAPEAGVVSLRIIGRARDDRGRLEDQLFHLLAAMDAPLREMTPEKDDLEAIFLEAIK